MATFGKALEFSWPERGIAVARFNRPKEMNTLSLELVEELGAALAEARLKSARALILTGSGRAFCCGAHLKYFRSGDGTIGTTPDQVRDRYLSRIASLYDQFEEMPFPVIAAINGYALGGGFEMALSCDFRVLADTAVVGLPETAIGATPGAGGVQKLHRFIGRGKALEWILLSRHITAAEVDRVGLAYKVAAPDKLMDEALELARALKRLSPMAITQAKTSIYVSGDADGRSARRAGIEALSILVGSRDWLEGMAAFNEKRKPRFEEF